MSSIQAQVSRAPKSVHYDIAYVKTRNIPTYYHDQIFSQRNHSSQKVRCTPTFHSDALQNAGYRPVTNQHLKQNQIKNTARSSVSYLNETKTERVRMLNPGQECSASSVVWYDDAKQKIFDSITKNTLSYSRQRKIADLASNPVFNAGVFIVETHQQNQQKDNKNNTNQIEQPATEIQNNSEAIVQQKQQNIQVKTSQQKNTHNDQKNNEVTNIQINQNVLEQAKDNFQRQNNQKAKNNKSIQNDKKVTYNIGSDITFGRKPRANARKINKTIAIGSSRPIFTIIRTK